MTAKKDSAITANIITRDMAKATGFGIAAIGEHDSPELNGSDGQKYPVLGSIKLQFRGQNRAETHDEIFYVVESASCHVILGVSSKYQEHRPEPLHTITLRKLDKEGS